MCGTMSWGLGFGGGGQTEKCADPWAVDSGARVGCGPIASRKKSEMCGTMSWGLGLGGGGQTEKCVRTHEPLTAGPVHDAEPSSKKKILVFIHNNCVLLGSMVTRSEEKGPNMLL
jgi:hypothetical protein